MAANLAITSNPDVQQMPSIAVNPLNPDHIVVAYMDYALLDTGYAGIGVAVSKDGASTWEHSRVELPSELNATGASGMAAPVVKFDNVDHDGDPTNDVQNRAYIAFMAAEFLGEDKPAILDPDRGAERAMGMQANNGIFVSESDDGGMTWSSPTVVSQQVNLDTGEQTPGINRYNGITDVAFDIKPDLAIDSNPTLTDGNPNPRYGQLYVTWVRFYPQGQFPGEAGISDGGSQIMIGVSDDSNATWSMQLETRPDTLTYETVLEDPGDTGITGLPPGRGIVWGTRVSVGREGDIYVSVQWFNGFIVFHSLAEVDGVLKFDRPVSPQEPTERDGWPFGIVPISPTPSGIPGLDFRLEVTRGIAADPTNPGTVYVVESSDFIPGSDHGDIAFSKSVDAGDTWSPVTEDRDDKFRLLNDDNDRARAENENDVVTSQVMPWLVAGANGRLAVIWYDTRRDPQGQLLDVFATVSDDYGQTFSPNFRVTTESFDANLGAFTNAQGTPDYKYLGDSIGLALAGQAMYAAWTDTRAGNQDIYFSRIELDSLPSPPNDRFEPNGDRTAATVLGPDPIFVTQLPKLTLANGDEDWFQVTATTNELSVAIEAAGASKLVVELFDESGKLIAEGVPQFEQGSVVVQSISREQVVSAKSYFVRVRAAEGVDLGTDAVAYALNLTTVTEVLGEVVHVAHDDHLSDSGQSYYVVDTKVAGSLHIELAKGGNFQGIPALQLIDPRNPTQVLAASDGSSPILDYQVLDGQRLLIRVSGGVDAAGDFTLEISNVDQYNSSATGSNKLTFASGDQPAGVAIADFNEDGTPDMVVSNTASNTVSVYTGNGDGTFRAPRLLETGAFAFTQQFFRQTGRYVIAKDLNGDQHVDIVVNNYDSSDVSVLLGRGDGTFEPQRRFNATGAPFSIDVGDLNGDGAPDLVVLDSTAEDHARVGVLLNRADRTGQADWGFRPLTTFASPVALDFFNTRVKIVDLNGDDRNDLLIGSLFDHTTRVLLGNGDGTFTRRADLDYRAFGADLQIADLNGDGHPDVVQTQYANLDKVSYSLNRGDGTGALFPPVEFLSGGASPIASVVVDYNGDKTLDLVVANSGEVQPSVPSDPSVVLLPGRRDSAGVFAGFGEPIVLASPKFPHDVQATDLNRDGAPDIVVVDGNSILAIFSKAPKILPNDARATARDLGVVTHLVQPTLTITPSHSEAWFRLRVPTEQNQNTGRQVLDFSGGFTSVTGGQLILEVIDEAGVVRGSGERFRVVAEQGEVLFARVYGLANAPEQVGGAYTLIVDTLPQIAAVEAHQLLEGSGNQAGGPTTSIVLFLQGDRLSAEAAENPENYTVIWLGNDGVKGGGDDRTIAVGAGLAEGAQGVVYSPDRDVQQSSGLSRPDMVQQTVTLRFGEALPAGSYEVTVSKNIIASAFNSDEAGLITTRSGFNGHALVSVDGSTVSEGYVKKFAGLVEPIGNQFDIDAFLRGNSFLQQIHNDLGTLLDAQLTRVGSDVNADDVQAFTADILWQIVSWFGPALATNAGEPLVSLLIIFGDPISIGLTDPNGKSLKYDLQTDRVSNQLNAYVEVGRNIELVVIPNPTGIYQLQVADIPASARAGTVYISNRPPEVRLFTDAIRAGVRSFQIGTASSSAGNFLPAMLSSVVQFSNLTTAVGNFQLAVTNWSDTALNFDQQLNVIAARSKQLATSAASPEDSGGGGFAAAATLRAINQAWDELSSLWDQLTGDGEEEVVTGSIDEGLTTPLLEAWKAITEAWSDLQDSESEEVRSQATGREEAAAAEESAPPAAAAMSDNQPVATPQAAAPENSEPSGGEIEQNVRDSTRPGDAPRSIENAPSERIGSNAHADAA